MELNFPKLEKKILKFWKEKRVFEKSVEQRAKARSFVFYEGPPTANAEPGIHHILSRVFKDIICRYKTMQGFKVLRKAGWDTHGLPVELEIEKKLRLKTKKEIEKYGIARFNKKCRESVWAYKTDWEKLTERIGFWLDMENPYITYQPDYIETAWWIIKQIWQKGLLYQDYKVVPYCPRCGTSLSSHEVALGYKKITEPAIYVKFKIKSANQRAKFKNAYLFVWTTTPWTLPGNVAIAVNPEVTYVLAKVDNEKVILAKESLSILGKNYEKEKELKGKELLGLEYKALFEVPQLKSDNSYKVYPADFVTTQEGTAMVHIAPMYGEDDYNLGRKFGLPTFHTVTKEGKFIKELGERLANLYAKNKETENLIIEYLKRNNLLFKEELYEHDYPFCWRCDSPLLYYAKESWFINMQKVKKELIKNNQKINWIPAHLKKGRFGEWLREIKDWTFSRERYWGTPLPIWQCKKCGNSEIIGSKKDLARQKFSRNKYFILRHGESLRNIEKITACWPEKTRIPLTKKGRLQIKKIAKKLKKEKIDLIFSSDLLRTKQTAEIAGEELGIKPKFDKRIRELNLGALNGMPVEKVGKFWDPERKLSRTEYYLRRFKIKAPKGENWTDAKKRMYQFLKEIDRRYHGKNILIISHELPLTVLEGAVKGFSREEIIKYRDRAHIKVGELRKLDFKLWPYNQEEEIDFHRPFVDGVKFYCPQCQDLMIRVPEVIDCWFDSGAMPFAQYHYPFENQKLQKAQFPADYISEAVDQTRGWFYTLHTISTLLERKPAYKNVISLGHVLDEKGEKMSKSKGNVVKPWPIVERYGADTTRWYFFTLNQPGDAKLFREREVEESLKRFLITLWNCYVFYKAYAAKSGFQRRSAPFKKERAGALLDKWILSKLNRLIQTTTQKLDNYDITGAAREIEGFVIDDFSQWYIRRSRKRFQKPKTKEGIKKASKTLGFVLLTLSKLTAPFIPFLSEDIYRNLRYQNGPSSVHLKDWPKVNKKLIDKKIENKMGKIRETVKLALAERTKAGIKVRQPLNELRITNYELRKEKELLDLIKEEVNIKKITFGKTLKLETKITPELKEEGITREVIRQIQEMRKRAGYKPSHRILAQCSGTQKLNEILTKKRALIQKEGKIKNFQLGKRPKQVFDVEREIKIDQQKLWLAIKKL